MSEIVKNKGIAKSYFTALSDGDVGYLDGILADDLTYWIVGNLPGLSGSHNKTALMGMIEPFVAMWDGRLEFEIVGAVAEGDKVVIEAKNHGTRKDGRVYHNAYNIVFELRDGLITHIREYFDTIHAKEVLL